MKANPISLQVEPPAPLRPLLHWDADATLWPQPEPPNVERAIWRAGKVFAELVHDIVHLEGNPFTFPEVQTLLEGITVGGHRISDAEQVLNQRDSLNLLLDLAHAGTFHLNAETACRFNALAARGEALEPGVFRTGQVGIAGTSWRPPPAGELPVAFEQMGEAIGSVQNPFCQGLIAFLLTAKNQFFWDGNKRTGRLLMNSLLLQNGQDIITVPAKAKQAFNEGMIAYYDSGDATGVIRLLLSSRLKSRFE